MDSTKNILKSGVLLQPILTVILIAILVVLLFQSFTKDFFNKSNTQTVATEKEIGQKVSFDQAVQKMFDGNFEVYTRGSLYIKSGNQTQSISSVLSPTPLPSVTQISLVENPYDNMIFSIEKGAVLKIETKSYGQNDALFFNAKGQIVYLNNSTKQYSLYPIPDDSEKDAVALFVGTKQVLQTSFPMVPLINDYKNGLFNPIERADNLYSGQWKNSIYTNNEVADVIIQTDPVTGTFRSFNVTNTQPPSQIYFEFRAKDTLSGYSNVPSDYKSVPLTKPYKTK